MNVTAILLAAIGLFLLVGVATENERLFNRRSNRWLVSALGIKGAKVLFSLVALICLVVGVLGWLEIIPLG